MLFKLEVKRDLSATSKVTHLVSMDVEKGNAGLKTTTDLYKEFGLNFDGKRSDIEEYQGQKVLTASTFKSLKDPMKEQNREYSGNWITSQHVYMHQLLHNM
ncbi:hypothetical protein Bpfe_030308 [Biomphalaria pfeifferi]|uniref:Uncharacterized protein n=1 Tax=Biomphalaria pfeifferi TaxID=112525 RepID=A0AAD8ETY7_BIOPF|nr:hypothetical protein Bpfe_030308 [Biomphalaria pfeifferi]